MPDPDSSNMPHKALFYFVLAAKLTTAQSEIEAREAC